MPRSSLLARAGPIASALALFLTASGMGAAIAQPVRPAPQSPPIQQSPTAPTAPALDPAQAASKSAFDRLTEPERKAIQNDLIWTGDFNGVAGGEFGKRTYDAMLAFERRTAGTADGILAPPERAALKRDADAARAVLRFGDITDPATGIRIGLPQALLTQRVAVANGIVWRRADGAASLQLSQLPPGQSFTELFDQLRQDTPGRKVTYRLQRPDWFVVSGEEGGRKFYTRLAQGPAGIRGYTFRYPVAEAATFDRIMVAIANTFEPFPGTDVAANPSRVAAPPTPPAPAPPPLVQPSLRAAEVRHAISGVALLNGQVLTSAVALKSCAGANIGGRPLGVAATYPGEVALVAVPGLNQPALAFHAGTVPNTVFTMSFEDGPARSVMVSPGRWEAEGSRVVSSLQTGAGGAPVIDGQGRLVGLVRESFKATRMVAGVVAQTTYTVIPVNTFIEALPPSVSTTDVLSSRAGFLGSRIKAASASLVEIRCTGRT